MVLGAVGSEAAVTVTGFQSMMTSWERWQPVNAVQFVSLRGSLELPQLQDKTEQSLQKLDSIFGGGRWRLNYGGESPDFRSVVSHCVPDLDTRAAMEHFVTDLMNSRFEDTDVPVRVGLARQNDASLLWICYRHSVADARSIAILLQHLAEEMLSEGETDLPLRLEDKSCPTTEMLKDRRLPLGILGRVYAACTSLRALQKCSRKARQRDAGFRMTFKIHGIDLSLSSLKFQARRHNASVGELFTAAMLMWLKETGSGKNRRPLTSGRCVSVLADITSRSRSDASGIFGQHICPFNIFDDGTGAFSEQLERVKTQLRGEENLNAAIRNLDSLALNSFLLGFLPNQLAQYDQDFLFPISGAISNVNLNGMLPEARSLISQNFYFRSTCATQFSPVIACLTTSGDSCTLTTTHLTAIYNHDEIHRLGLRLLQTLFDVDCEQCGSLNQFGNRSRHVASVEHQVTADAVF